MGAGVLSQISFKEETTWGTEVVPDKSIGVKTGDGIQTDIDLQLPESIRAQLAKNYAAFVGAKRHEGSYEFDVIPGYIGWLLKSVFGSVSSVLAGGETIVYDHTFSEAENKSSLTIEQAVGDIVRRFAGCIATSVRFSCEVGGPLIAEFNFLAKSSASATKVTASYETVRPFNFKDLSNFAIGGTVFDELEAFELEFTNALDVKHVLGDNDPKFNYPQGSEVTGSFDLYLNNDSAAKYTDYLNKTERSIDIDFTGDSIGTASNYKLQIDVPKAVFRTATFPIRDDYNLLTIEFDGIYDTATSKLISMILTNLTSAY